MHARKKQLWTSTTNDCRRGHTFMIGSSLAWFLNTTSSSHFRFTAMRQQPTKQHCQRPSHQMT